MGGGPAQSGGVLSRPALRTLIFAGGAGLLAAASAGFLWACWRNGTIGHPEARLDQWHHFYLALPLAIAGAMRRSPALLMAAALVAADDAWQHVQHTTGAWDYQSPLRRLFAATLWPLEPIRRLAAWLNAALG
jgi:hypothetical protein